MWGLLFPRPSSEARAPLHVSRGLQVRVYVCWGELMVVADLNLGHTSVVVDGYDCVLGCAEGVLIDVGWRIDEVKGWIVGLEGVTVTQMRCYESPSGELRAQEYQCNAPDLFYFLNITTINIINTTTNATNTTVNPTVSTTTSTTPNALTPPLAPQLITPPTYLGLFGNSKLYF